MTSPLLALFVRSLREETRAKATYFVRGVLPVFLLLIMASVSTGMMTGGASGLMFFSSIIWLEFACVALAGTGYFAAAISEEKEEMTLGLLRMTNLSPVAILLGKSTSRLAGVLLMLVGLFPFTVLAVTLGGIAIHQIVAAYCLLGAFTFFLCNLAMLASVIARRTATAVVMTLAVLAVFFFSGPFFGWLAWVLKDLQVDPLVSSLKQCESALWKLTPLARMGEILSTGFSGGAIGTPVVIDLVAGLLCFGLAWLVFNHFCDRALDGPASASGTVRFLGIRRRVAPPRPGRNAIAWKEFHYACGGRRALWIRIAIYLLLLLSYVPQWSSMMFFGASQIVGMLLVLDAAFIASRIFRKELQEQTFPTIAGLPVTMRHLVRAKIRGSLPMLMPGVFLFIMINGLWLLAPKDPNVVFQMPLLMRISSWVGSLALVFTVAYLSLVMKRGALPVAIVLYLMVSTLSSILMMAALGLVGGFGAIGQYAITWTYGANTVVYALICLVLRDRMFRRLEALAGEG